MRSYDKYVVYAASSGRYNELARRFFPEMGEALLKPGKHVGDPWLNRPSKDGFRVLSDFNQSGKMVCNSHFGCGKIFNFLQLFEFTGRTRNFNDTLEIVGEYLHCPRTGMFLKGSYEEDNFNLSLAQQEQIKQLQEQQAILNREIEERKQREFIKNSQTVEKILRKSVSLRHPNAREAWDYLESRFLGGLYDHQDFVNDLRYARLPYYEDGHFVDYFGALIGVIKTLDNRVWALHRTFLQGGLKAKVSSPKKLTGVCFEEYGSRFICLGGSTIPQHGIIGIAEGIETALSCVVKVGMPVWSSISASYLRTFVPPKGVKGVCVFADKDASGTGQNAAAALVKKLRELGFKAKYIKPHSPIAVNDHGVDWNDELRHHKRFPTLDLIYENIMNDKLDANLQSEQIVL